MEKEQKLKKAGFFIYGLAADPDGHPRMHAVFPYTEGRFNDRYKTYSMLKGSIDPGETSLQTALREGAEESGLDIPTLLGAAYEDFLAGKVIEHAPSNYPGVTIKHAHNEPVIDHTYTAGYGAHNRTHYYAIEVEGIENLRPFLKRMSADEDPALPCVKHTAKELAEQRDLPKLNEMINILRTGIVPAGDKQWMGAKPQTVLTEPHFAAMEKDWAKSRDKKRISSLRDWKQFCDRSLGNDCYHQLEHDFELLKKYFEARGVIGDYGGQMKMDSKDIPLRFYQEAAELLPVGEAIDRMAKQADRCDIFRRAGWGEYSGPRREPVDEKGMMDRAQLAPLMDFFSKIAPMEIASAAITGRDSLDPRVMRAVDGFVEPVVASDGWRERVLAPATAQQAEIER